MDTPAQPMYPEDLDADNWDRCSSLWLYGDYFAGARCPDARTPSERKLRLMVVAALRAVWEYINDPRSRAGVEAAERFADDLDRPALEAAAAAEQARAEAGQPWDANDPQKSLDNLVAWKAWQATEPEEFNDVTGGLPFWAEIVADLESDEIPGRTREEAEALHLALFRDLFPNPFRPVAFDPGWRTSAAVGLAAGMYEARDFGAMPVLADALEEAGCDAAEVLAHCRGPGPHARGCRVVDLVLGKS